MSIKNIALLVKKVVGEEFNELNLKKELFELINAGLSLSAASKYLAKKKNTIFWFVLNNGSKSIWLGFALC